MSSLSNQEVSKFSAMDQDWWDPKKNPLISMNTVRVRYIRDRVTRHFANSEALRFIDIGCGGGLLSESLARVIPGSPHIVGIDPSETLVNAARDHAKLDTRSIAQRIEYWGGMTAESFAQDNASSFDVVCLLEVLEHATNVPSLLEASARLLKPNGLLFVSTINKTLKSYLLTIVGAEYIMGYLPPGTHNWNQYLSSQSVQTCAEPLGLHLLDVSGMVITRPPFFGSWDWKLDPHDTDVNWIGVLEKKVSA